MKPYTTTPEIAKGLTKEDIDFIKELSNEMRTQDTRCTAQPYGLVIRTKRTVWGFDPDYGDSSNMGLIWGEESYKADEWSDFINQLEEYEYHDLLKEIDEFGVSNFVDLERICDIRSYDFTIACYQEGMVADSSSGGYEGNFFLTEKAAFAHIEQNKHHFNSPDTYGIHLFRNPEMKRLLEIVHKIADGAE
ncbi:hypothetical protein WCX49_11920 [Sulfurimonas sp. HSL-1656]|uniref:hypothetical protein n=1 Tax=Thiomicrolovo subterrani TaxID=3131934 RepID=UPI0031F86DFC